MDFDLPLFVCQSHALIPFLSCTILLAFRLVPIHLRPSHHIPYRLVPSHKNRKWMSLMLASKCKLCTLEISKDSSITTSTHLSFDELSPTKARNRLIKSSSRLYYYFLSTDRYRAKKRTTSRRLLATKKLAVVSEPFTSYYVLKISYRLVLNI